MIFPSTTPRLCLTLTGRSPQDAAEQIRLHLGRIDMIELRLDLWSNYSLEALQILRRECALPMIYTLRPKRQGGAYEGDETTRYQALQQLIALKPDYLDVEYDLPLDWLEQLQKSTVRLIHSYHHMSDHHMTGMPENLDDLYQALNTRKRQDDLIKIACTPQNSAESLQLLAWAKQHPNTLVIGMGEYGAPTRICAPCVDTPWSYVHADNHPPAAPGQLSCNTLRTLYRFPSLTATTPLYGLLGDPVTGSISHWSHNLFFKLFAIPALYLKYKTTTQELPTFLDLARQLGFKGFSVTHPLKEQIIPHLDAIDADAKLIGAVNTLRLEEGKWVGYNTDGAGALDALQASGTEIQGKCAIVLGSGGCAKAIAHTLKAQGCNIIIMSRNNQTGQHLADCVEGRWLPWNLDTLPTQRAHLLIQATSSAIEIKSHQLESLEVVMETITLPKESTLTQAALLQGCRVVYGYCMFEAQALKQMKLWFQDTLQSTDQESHIYIQLDAWRRLIASAVSEGNIPDSIPDYLPSTKENCYHIHL